VRIAEHTRGEHATREERMVLAGGDRGPGT
jgi:hypothetical protein